MPQPTDSPDAARSRDMDLWGRLEQHRVRVGLEIAPLVRAAGIARQTYYNIEKSNNTSVDTLARLAHVLGVEPADLLRDRQTAPTPEAVTLARCRDLLTPDGTDDPPEFARIVELAWRAKFQGGPAAT